MHDSADRPATIVAVNRDDTIQKAAALMLSHNVGCLIVNNEDGDFVGVVSERDVARRVATGCDTARTSVAQIMTDHVISCPPGTPTHEARRIMATHRIRHLPIVENGVVAGILSVRDVMAQQLAEDRAAAEEVAVLSKCLKSIDLQEAVEIVAMQAPKLFEATSCALCLYPSEDTTKGPEFVSSNRCLCFDGSARCPEFMGGMLIQEGLSETIPAECVNQGGHPPRLMLPLEIAGLCDPFSGKEKRLRGFVCMCGLDAACTVNKELTSYKARLAREIVVAHLTNALRYQQARLTSLTDALTGVGSRKLLEDKLQEEYDRAKRYKRPFSVAIIDLDHFKMINDTLGHAAGDDAIRQLAQCMNEQKRIPDVLARYGGDEFVMLMPENPGRRRGRPARKDSNQDTPDTDRPGPVPLYQLWNRRVSARSGHCLRRSVETGGSGPLRGQKRRQELHQALEQGYVPAPQHRRAGNRADQEAPAADPRPV